MTKVSNRSTQPLSHKITVTALLSAIAFILQNRDSVQVDLLTFQFSAPQWVTLLVVFLAGLATGLLWSRRKR